MEIVGCEPVWGGAGGWLVCMTEGLEWSRSGRAEDEICPGWVCGHSKRLRGESTGGSLEQLTRLVDLAQQRGGKPVVGFVGDLAGRRWGFCNSPNEKHTGQCFQAVGGGEKKERNQRPTRPDSAYNSAEDFVTKGERGKQNQRAGGGAISLVEVLVGRNGGGIGGKGSCKIRNS